MSYFTASCNTVKENTDFAKSLDLDYSILSDPTGATAKSYGIHNGRFSSRCTFYIGKDGKILHIDKKVNSGQHAADVVKKLGELGVAKR